MFVLVPVSKLRVSNLVIMMSIYNLMRELTANSQADVSHCVYFYALILDTCSSPERLCTDKQSVTEVRTTAKSVLSAGHIVHVHHVHENKRPDYRKILRALVHKKMHKSWQK